MTVEDDDRLRTLRQRARQLAQAPESAAPLGQFEVLVFQLAGEHYAVETSFVREVYPLKELTAIPCTPGFLLGVINVRGELCPVIELKRLLGLPDRGLTNATRAVIVHSKTMEWGIVADVIVGVRSVGLAELRPTPLNLSGINASFLRGVTADHLVVLDAGAMLGHAGMIVDEQVAD